MKLNTLILLIVTLVSGQVFAQSAEKNNSSEQNQTSVLTLDSTANTNYESVRIEEPQSLFTTMKMKSLFSDLDFKFFSFASTMQQQIINGGQAYDSYNYIGIQKKLSDSSKFGFRLPFLYSTSGLDKAGKQVESKSSLSDVILFYSENNLYDLPFLSGSGSLKLYLPTSEFSKVSKTYAQLRAEIYNSTYLGKYSKLTYAFKPEYHLQSQVAYLDPNTVKNEFGEYSSEPRRLNTKAKLEHYLEASFDINKSISIAPAVGFYEEWKYSSQTEQMEGQHNTYSKQAIGMKIRPFSGWSFTLGRETKTKLTNLGGKTAKYNDPKDTTIYLMTEGSLN